MKQIILFLSSVLFAVSLTAQATLIDATKLIKPGATSTILTTNSSGAVTWVAAYTAGTGISVSAGNVITNTSPNQTVSISGVGITVSGTYPAFTLTATDASATNEAQTLTGGGTTTPTVTLSTAGGAGGGTITFSAGSGVSLNQSTNTITVTATDASATNELQTLAISGTTNPTITLSNSGGSFNFVAGAGVSLNQSGGAITIANTVSAPTWSQEVFENQTGSSVTTTGTLPTDLNKVFIFRSGVHMLHGTGEDVTVSGNVITFGLALAAERVVVRWTN